MKKLFLYILIISSLVFGFNINAAVDDAYTMSLLHCDGTDASTTFTDESGKTVTEGGNAQIDTARQKFGSASGLFDGNGDNLTWSDSADFSPGTGAFTIDGWIYQTSNNSYSTLIDLRGSDVNSLNDVTFLVNWGTDRYVVLYGGQNAPGYTFSSLNALPQNEWVHIAIVGNGGASGSRNMKFYINGTLAGTATGDYDLNRGELSVGGPNGYNTTFGFVGSVDEFRFSKGIQRWTTDFTPPTSAYAPAGNIKSLNGTTYPTAVKSRNGILQSVINYINGIK